MTDPTSTLTDAQVAAEAARLDAAERERRQIRPTSKDHAGMTIDDAYRVQDAWRELRTARGERIIGHKIGLTSRAMQLAMQIETPDSGFLTDAMVIPANGSFAAADHGDPKLEIELAFVLGRDLAAPDLSVDDVLDATDHVRPAVELIAARTFRVDPDTGARRTVVDTISDNAADAGISRGGRQIGPREVDLAWVGAVGRRNGVVEETGLAAGVGGHPALGIAWLAARYHSLGRTLAAGDVVLAGSFTRPIDCRPGDEFHFDYGPLGAFGLSVT